MAEARMFFGGLPYGPDVAKLVAKFGVPAVGALISHEDIADCIGHDWKTARYTGVVASWRSKLRRDHNIDTAAEVGVGVKILTGQERIDASEGDFKASTRQLRRAAVRISVTPEDGLTDDQKKRRGHLQEVTARVYMAQANEHKSLRPPQAPPALPRRSAG